MKDADRRLSLGKLTFFSIGATLASGIFSLSGDFAAAGAHPLAVLIGWGICGIGMFSLTMCFFRLSIVRPDLTSGLYSYAKEGFGPFVGFHSAWGYWLSAVLGNLSFIILLFASLGNFFPVFGNGTNGLSMLLASVMIWAFAFFVLRGINQAIAINTIVVIAKIIPVIVMIGAIVFAGAFHWDIFLENFTADEGDLPLMDQVKATVYTTVWIFIGIEGAVVLSGRAETTKAAGKATILAFLVLFLLYVLISMLSMGVMTTEELASLQNPPMAGLLESVTGPWGASLVNIGVIISVGGALFTYTILCVDSIYAPALQHCFPKVFTKQNKNGAPVGGVLITTLVTQFFLILIYFNDSTYQICYALSTSAIMVPYALSSFYCLKITWQGKEMENLRRREKTPIWAYSVIGSAYGLWMLYASGITYILISALLYTPGILFYYWARKEEKLAIFPRKTDLILLAVLLIMAIYSLFMLSAGAIKIL